MTETIAAGSAEAGQAETGDLTERDLTERDLTERAETVADLRRTGINPDFWYPVAVSASVRKKKTFPALFAGERIALYRGESGAVYALEDRCAHRQVPLSMGVVEGDVLRCCYHAWAYRGTGRISQIPYLPKGVSLAATRRPRLPGPGSLRPGVRLPRRPGEGGSGAAARAAGVRLRRHKTMMFSRTVSATTPSCTRTCWT